MLHPGAQRFMTSPVTRHVRKIIEAPVADIGYEIVRVSLSGGARRVLQVMVERADRDEMTVDDCAGVSRLVSTLLDVEDPVDGAYSLEVSSPGIDRPLTRPADFERFAGFEARIELAEPQDGRRRLRGRLQGLDEAGAVRLDVDGTRHLVRRDAIRTARLVLTDDLIAASRRRPVETPNSTE